MKWRSGSRAVGEDHGEGHVDGHSEGQTPAARIFFRYTPHAAKAAWGVVDFFYALTQKATSAIAHPSTGELFGCQLDLCYAGGRKFHERSALRAKAQKVKKKMAIIPSLDGGWVGVGGDNGSTPRTRRVLLQRSTLLS